MAHLFPNLKLKLKPRAEEIFDMPFPQCLSLPLQNHLQACSSGTTMKLYSLGSSNSLLRHIFIGSIFVSSVICTGRLLSRCMHCSQKKNDFIKLWSNATRFLASQFCREEAKHVDPDPKLAGEAAHVDVPVEVSRKDAPLELAGEVAHVDLPLEVSRKDTLPELAGDQVDLPPELWGEIGKRLASRLDILWFRSVCRNWRACLSYPSRFPLRVPPPPNCVPEFLNVPFFITEVTLYTNFNKSHYYEVEEVEQGGKFVARYLWKQEEGKLSSDDLICPPTHPLSKHCFVSKGFCFRMPLPQEERVEGRYWDLRCKTFAHKVVLISSNVDGVNPSYTRASDLSVIAHLNCGEMEGRLALLRLGRAPENRKWDTNFCPHVFGNIATYRGRLCALDPLGRVFVMDYNSLKMTQIAAPPPFLAHPVKWKHLIEHRGDLYMVHLPLVVLDVYKVYMLCFQRQEWLVAGNTFDVLRTLYPSYVGF